MASPSTQHAVDIDELSASIEKKLHILPPLSSERCIYKAPHAMKSSCKQYFTPQIVPIGPMHYQNKKLRANEHLKEKYLAEFCELTKVSLKECLKLILEHESRLRNCYADVIELNSQNFVKMILLDAVFLLMILVYKSCEISHTDLVYKNPEMIMETKYDLLLLENELPFFILDDLYKLSKLQSILESKFELPFSEETTMIFLAHRFLNSFLSPKVTEQHPPSKPKHILDLYRSCSTPADWNPKRHKAETMHLLSTKKLHQVELKIQVGCKENMFHIRFNDGKLEIAPLFIFDPTEQLFRNLLAYELCHCRRTRIFSNYFQMMRLLSLSSKDMELLVQNGVIINRLSNAERVSTLFQNIDTGNVVNFSKFLYGDVINGLNEYYKLDWHKWVATLKEKYFKAPWTICSVSDAVLLIVLTIVQTVFTVL